MSDGINKDVIRTESEGMKTDRMEMIVEIYESAECVRDHDFRTETNTPQPLQRTESRQLISKNENLTNERDQLLTNITNLTEERDGLKIKNKNLTNERDQLKLEKNDLQMSLGKLADGWIYNQSSLYFISSEKRNWAESRRYCTERGADLIIINNREEQEFVKNSSDSFWIGLTDSDVEGRWKWVDGTNMTSGFWGSGEPNSYNGDEDCAMIYSSGWADYPCNDAFRWICEKIIFK
ncbi:CD209 antigen-like protein C isoform X3 [Megalobrama amblycephala]|uniref:CD209 antigen-like protein C isoform X3 n=1 Tax=Megalobrama amblycephala TaxID=75352 RepID=UPI00201430EF|nr:CD209 antigen-like protein C isoform X3 [Megalobrama amblycephala]